VADQGGGFGVDELDVFMLTDLVNLLEKYFLHGHGKRTQTRFLS